MHKLFLFALLLCAIPAVAAVYYADITIDVDADGTIRYSGLTNHPALQGSSVAQPIGNIWLLNITINDSFSDYLYVVHLPAGASVNYIRSPNLVRISEEGGRLTVRGTGSNEPLGLLIQYTVEKRFSPLGIILAAIAIIIVAAGVYLYLHRKPKRDWSGLPERQRQIVQLLEKKPLTQRQLEQALTLPKSSLSRNIDPLVRKDIVIKEDYGMTNRIRLK